MLETFGFSQEWINLIYNCIATPEISILINGTSNFFFNISRRIRQRDPISSFLFIIIAEAFGRAIKNAQDSGIIKGVMVTKGIPNITHQQFADDAILLGQSTIVEGQNYKQIIKTYTEALGQIVNAEKSEIFFLNTKPEMERKMCNIMGYKKDTFPCKYLGIQLETNMRETKSWNVIIDKIDKKLENWLVKWLTKAGRATKIK